MTTSNDPRVDPSTDQTHKFTDDVKSAFRGIRGAGDAIRGTAMEAIDSAADSKEGEARDRALAEKGMRDMRGADHRFAQRREEHHVVGPAAGGQQGVVDGGVGTNDAGVVGVESATVVVDSQAHAGAVPGQGQGPPARQGTGERVQNQHLQQHQQQHHLGHGYAAGSV